jgi:hypothetical protein
MRHACAIAILLVLSAAAFGAPAAPAAKARRTVLKVDGERIYVDLGSADGVEQGVELRLYHAITATHPVTKKKVRDTFYLGNLFVLKVGKHLAVASAGEEVIARIQAGDEVELAGQPHLVVDSWEMAVKGKAVDSTEEPIVESEDPVVAAAEREAAERRKARAAAQAEVDDAARAREVWSKTLGKSIPERVALWTEYVNGNPGSPYVAAVRDEIASLNAQDNIDKFMTLREKGVVDAPEEGIDAPYLFTSEVALMDPLAWIAPQRIYEQEQLELAYLVVRPAAVKTGWVHYRRRGDGTYKTLQANLDGDGYLRVTIPGHDVVPPVFEYFVEVMGEGQDRPVEAVGSAATPTALVVDASVAEPKPDIKDRSRVTIIVDYVNFDADTNLDSYLQGSVDFMYRFNKPIYAMRLGFATLRGKGGPKDIIDTASVTPGREPCTDSAGVYRCRDVAFNYAYVELEMRVTSIFSLMTRVLYGSSSENSQPPNQPELREYTNNGGLHVSARLGNERETNLTISAATIAGLGQLIEAAFTWSVIRPVPIVISAQVTDQPIPEDFGVRLILDVGYRGPSWIYPSLRVSYAARDIDHAGYGIGTALNFDW